MTSLAMQEAQYHESQDALEALSEKQDEWIGEQLKKAYEQIESDGGTYLYKRNRPNRLSSGFTQTYMTPSEIMRDCDDSKFNQLECEMIFDDNPNVVQHFKDLLDEALKQNFSTVAPFEA